MNAFTAAEPLALYIHWPFCLQKCPYCDFNSHVRAWRPDARMGSALVAELRWEAARLGRRPVPSIFFGGGTPSLMPSEFVARLIETARTCLALDPDAEITLEANPTSVELGELRGFREAGVNRLSLGVQALDDGALQALGRGHSATEARRALGAAREIYPRLSFDLIYARPGQTERAWREELRSALHIASDHLSLYQLTIEPGTTFAARHAAGRLVLPDEDEAAALYGATGEEAARFGLHAYEVSNYARPGAESRHNLAYWRYGDYLGIGPGAHGRVTRDGALFATRRHRVPERWAAAVEATGHGMAEEEPVSARERAREALLMGLRLTEGVRASRFLARTGMVLGDALDPDGLTDAVRGGFVRVSDTGVAMTPHGRMVLETLLPRLVA